MLPLRMTGCSWKGYLGAEAADAWLAAVRDAATTDPDGVDGLFVCVPHPLVPRAVEALAPLGVLIGAQDVSAYPAGPYTGEVAADLLAELGCRIAMVGHPERRALGETPEATAQKAAAAAGAGLVPLVIVGETSETEDARRTLAAQLQRLRESVPDSAELLVAYEPAWAIGRAEPAPASHVAAMIAFVQAEQADRAGGSRTVYGGSAGPGTFTAITEEAARQGVRAADGVFLGRAGLDTATFLAAAREVRGVG